MAYLEDLAAGMQACNDANSQARFSEQSQCAKRDAAWVLKNRQSQKRFRDKQKACKNQLQQSIQDMACELEELELQHAELQSRSRVLDLMLDIKQQQYDILQRRLQKQGAFLALEGPDKSSSSVQQSMPCDSTNATPNSKSGSVPDGQMPPTADAVTQPEGTETASKADSATATSSQLSAIDDWAVQADSTEVVPRPDHAPKTNLQLSTTAGRVVSTWNPHRVPPSHPCSPVHRWENHGLPASLQQRAERVLEAPTDINLAYANLINGVQELLLKVDAQGGLTAELYAEIDEQTDLVGDLLKYHCLDHPENYRKLLVVDLEQPAWAAPDLTIRTMDHWQTVTDFVAMKPQQKQEVVQLRAKFMRERVWHAAQRDFLCIEMQQATDGAAPKSSSAFSLKQDIALLQALKVNMQQNTSMWMQFYVKTFAEVWSADQYARALVASGPHHIDALAIATCIAEEGQATQHRQTALQQQTKQQGFGGVQPAAVLSGVCLC